MAKVNTGPSWSGSPPPGEFYVPAGGEAGYHLVKTSNTDGAYEWMAPPSMPTDSMEGVWEWQATPVTAPLAAGVVGVDTDDPRTATMLTINLADMDGNDRSAMFEGVSPDDTVTATVVGESASWHRYVATGDHLLNGSNYLIPVTTVDGSASGTEPSTGAQIVVVVDRQAPAIPGPVGPPGPPGGSVIYEGVWSWTNKTADASINGQVGNNTFDWVSATVVNISERTSNNTDVSMALNKLVVGDGFYIQQQNDSTRWGRYDITGAGVDNGTWRAYPVTLSSLGSSGGTPTNNAATVVRLVGTAATSYVYSQPTPAAVWIINHNLGWYPNVSVTDSGGSDVVGDIAQTSTSTLTLTFSAAFAGTAYLS